MAKKTEYSDIVAANLSRVTKTKVKDTVAAVLERVEREKNVDFTDCARDLIFRMIYAVVDDPSSRWQFDRANATQVKSALSEMLLSIPSHVDALLGNGVREHTVKIGFPILIHYVSENIEAFLPFPKDPPPEEDTQDRGGKITVLGGGKYK